MLHKYTFVSTIVDNHHGYLFQFFIQNYKGMNPSIGYICNMDTQGENKTKFNTRTTTAPAVWSEMGKVPPQAIEIEQAVIGALLLDNDAVNDTLDLLTPDSFYDPKHQYIFTAIRELFATSQPIDLLTVVNQLQKTGELEASGGRAYITQLTARVASAAHIEFHARVIAEKHIKREMIKMGAEVMKLAFDDTKDVFEIMNKAEQELFKITQSNTRKDIDEMKHVVRDAIDEIEKASQNKDGISGVPTGFINLDKLTAGWQKSDMIVIAARPAMGKTAFVLSMARNCAVDYNQAVALFSLEMSSVQLVKRLIASEARLPADKLRKGDLKDHEFQQLHSRISKLSQAPIYIDDTPGISIFDLRAKCRRLKSQKNIDIIIIDYLQLMTAGVKNGGNREQEISLISRSIKEIAKELNVPIIALSQLSRSVEQRGGDKKPILSDLRESGAIEQDADIVSFIYRPEYYGLTEDSDGNPTKGIGEIIIAKHRNGGLDSIKLKFVGQYARFENLESSGFDLPDVNMPSSMNANHSFDEAPALQTIQSKMNGNEDDFTENSDSPF
ncbi:MAG: replicative DNA helicase [Lentimonas sp.]|jgi:replicative DNA helicase